MFAKVFRIKEGELYLLIYSFLFIFCVFVGYAILRPIRDALGLHGGHEELKWLFLGTFFATLVGSLIAMWFSGVVRRKVYLDYIFLIFCSHLLFFYFAMQHFSDGDKEFLYLARGFYIWMGVFNLFIISSAWSVLSDLFSKDRSKRLFGVISAGASLGGIFGASSVSLLSNKIGVENFLFISLLFLCFAIFLKNLIVKQICKELDSQQTETFLHKLHSVLGAKNPFVGFKLIMQSKYLLAMLGFILLLTSVSTFLYMEQARIIEEQFTTREEKAAVFAKIDLIVQSSSLLIQLFFTAWVARVFGLKWLLSLLGFLVAIGFFALCFVHPAFLPLAIVMSLRRIGEYALIKPGRDMLFVPLDSESKYKVKNFFDTVVYRGGDVLSAQLEGLLAQQSILLTLFVGGILSLLWGVLGFYLGKKYDSLD